MNDEFYSKFPSFNKNSKENRRHQKITIDYKDFLKAKKITSTDLKSNVCNTKRSQIPIPKPIDVFCVEERNKIAENEYKEKQMAYQKILEQQIEEEKAKRRLQKEKEEENERILEERLQKQIESMKLENQSNPWESKKVERTSLSENDKYHPSRAKNDVYRYFSRSSVSLFNYRDRYFHDLDIAKINSDQKLMTSCTQCHKKLEILCSDCKHLQEINEILDADENDSRTNYPVKMLTFKENFAPYTFDNSSRLQKNSLDDFRHLNYSKLYRDLKKRNDITNRRIESKKGGINIEDLLGSNHQQYTVITGYAKSLLGKT